MRSSLGPSTSGLRPSAVFWEATARNAWMAGVLGAVLNFVLALGHAGTPVEEVLKRLVFAFVPAIHGIVLAGLCSVVALKRRDRMWDPSSADPAEDRAVIIGKARDYGWASRAAWLLFPLISLLFLFVAFLVVTTPFPVKHAP